MHPINYYAEDSVVVMIKNKKIFLYGKTKTEYKDVTVNRPAGWNRPADANYDRG
jgi:hypothetical protein